MRYASISAWILSLLVWQPGSGTAEPLLTPWAAEVSSTNVLPEYPRPQFAREHWRNLNGLWDYALAPQQAPTPRQFTNQIRVPYPIESHLSGVGQRLEENTTLWYRRSFRVPEAWSGQTILLHFGAVDWSAKVFVNGRSVATHSGGYDSFTVNVTGALHSSGENELLVAVTDPTEGNQPRGKQSRRPEGAFYSPSSGIWQTVWLEPVAPLHLTGLDLVPELGLAALRAWVSANTSESNMVVEAVATFDGREVGHATGAPGAELKMPLRAIHPWSPETPALYDLEVTLRRGTEVLDRARSYFGMREMRVGTDQDGRRALFLNGRRLFHMGVLDQGYWPDGLYTAPSDEALRFDIQTAKRLGFNLIRKHVKVEPERWYYWADRLGMLVWQDMPSGNNTTEPARRQFEMELQRMVEQKGNHPCIAMWVLFNEGWGQYETERLVRRLKLSDPTRLVNSASGWTDLKVGDVIDVHSYPDPIAPAAELSRAGVLGEFGGLHLEISDRVWSQPVWGYQRVADSGYLAREYASLIEKVWHLQESKGLAAAVYTQLTDVETECNGFLTYDRTILKMDAAQVRKANLRRGTPELSPMLLGDARTGKFSWSYTTNQPSADWFQPGFDASLWSVGPGGFGTAGTPDALVHTTWNTSDIWLRREFDLPENFSPPSVLTLSHDEDVELYLNGVPVGKVSKFSVGYQELLLSAAARSALRAGANVLTIHCHQSGGGQYIDAGLSMNYFVP